MKAIASYIMRGPFQATTVVSVTAILSLIVPFLNYFSGAALALVTLRQGLNAGLIILVGSSAIFSAFTYFFTSLGQVPMAVFGFVALLGMVWVLAAILRYTLSLAKTLQVAGGIGFIFVLIIYAATDPAAMWQQATTQFFAPVLEQADEQSRTVLEEQIAEASQYITGLFAAGVILNCAVCLFLGRWWQALLYNPGGFQQEFHGLRLNHTFAIFTAVVGAISFLPAGIVGAIAGEIFSVALILFFLQALAVAHAIVHMKKMSVGWLVGLYMLSPILLKLIGLVGFIDTWLNFRDKVRGSISKS
jgi:hypothetical protein